MSKDKLTDYDATAGNNTDIGGISVDEGMLPSNVNNALRELMSHLKDFAAGTQGVTTIGVDTINETTTDGGVTVDGLLIKDKEIGTSAAPATLQASAINGGQIGGRRNLIINGAMQVAQRGTSVTNISGAGYQALDRMRHSTTQINTARFTQEQVSDAPDGFSNSLKLTTTTAEGGIPANGRVSVIDYRIEAQDLQHLKYGTSNAQKITLSFYVKCSLTGSTTVGIYAPDGDRSIGQSYTINSANTWEYKTLTFDGDTGGTINNDNGIGLELMFQVAAGSDYTSTALQTSWGASADINDEMNGGNTLNLIDTLNATFQITGIQLEVGSVATEFEHRSFGEELALCQRYYQSINTNGRTQTIGFGHRQATNTVRFSIPTPVTLRADPSISISGTVNCQESDGSATATTSISGLYNSNAYVVATGTVSGVVAGSITMQGHSGTVQIDAEL